MQTIAPAALTSLEREKIVSFLLKHPVGVLATIDSMGHPQASTIYFTVNHDLYLTFTTKRETHKYENISRHTTVALVVYDAESQTEVQINGQAIEVTNLEDQEAIYYGTLHAAQQTGEDPVPPIAKIVAGTYVGFATYEWPKSEICSRLEPG
jgi:nitroimidazol reductase NimA-like FMN-containing flavoprotein (pyridoxamine 5'-phosphate oxidase superfamily)